jgi:hypothetical protein
MSQWRGDADAGRPQAAPGPARGGARRAPLPEHTRRATLLERLTVVRLSWDHVVRLHRYVELLGKLATAVWAAFVASFVPRSMLGFARWRLQRELWRRDVDRLTSARQRDQT